MKHLYILLSRTGTLPARMIHGITKGTFSHSSLALSPQTDRFYSYARRTLHNPLNAGIIVEDIHSFVFARYPHCHCALLAIEVSDEAHAKTEACILRHLRHYRKAKYNFLGALPLRMGIRVPRKFKLVCSQFVARALEESGEIRLPKDPYLMLPDDFLRIEGVRVIYDGELQNCRFDEKKTANFAPAKKVEEIL